MGGKKVSNQRTGVFFKAYLTTDPDTGLATFSKEDDDRMKGMFKTFNNRYAIEFKGGSGKLRADYSTPSRNGLVLAPVIGAIEDVVLKKGQEPGKVTETSAGKRITIGDLVFDIHF